MGHFRDIGFSLRALKSVVSLTGMNDYALVRPWVSL